MRWSTIYRDARALAARTAIDKYEIEGLTYLLAAGNAGIETATNDFR